MTPTSPSTSVSLLMRTAAQEPAAWEQFTEIYGPLVYGWCRRAGLQPVDAADVSQETFATVAVKLSDFRREHSGDSFRGWQ
ncbi:MAG: sigma-70 family RNA polymerase sigma factor [Planctomycetes bacterium]|nr:sigma-70 family RNA polymerase sigma factor [Planctomycetota bacterium]